MIENKRFVKYDGNTIVDLKLVRSWTISNGDVDELLRKLNNKDLEIAEKARESSQKIIYDSDLDLLVTADFYADYDQLKKENEELKSELRKIYDVATINKAIEIVDNIYEELLYKTSEESKYKRDIILKCLEKLDNFKDDIE